MFKNEKLLEIIIIITISVIVSHITSLIYILYLT